MYTGIADNFLAGKEKLFLNESLEVVRKMRNEGRGADTFSKGTQHQVSFLHS